MTKPKQFDPYSDDVPRSWEPGVPDARDLEILEVLQQRDGRLSEVELKDGRTCEVWNIAWGYDAGDSWAHVTTNTSPYVAGQDLDFFFTHEVQTIREPESAVVLVPRVVELPPSP
jgi:hypothetical protein